MKKLLLNWALLLGLFISSNCHSEIVKTVTWKVETKNKEVKVGDIIEILFTADILPEYYIYGSGFSDEIGPNPTQLNVEQLTGGELIGGLVCKSCVTKYDEVFEADIPKAYKSAIFVQKVKIIAEKFFLRGAIDGQSCTIEDGSCRIFNYDFDFNLTAQKGLHQPRDQYAIVGIPKEKETTQIDCTLIRSEQQSPSEKTSENPVIKTEKKKSSKDNDGSGLFGFMLIAFGAGLVALMTPCVYPMIPMTVTLFTKQKSDKNRYLKPLVYSLSIILIYTLLGTLTALILGPAAANFFSTNWIVNLVFFGIFIVFAFSFLGMFEITLPNAFVNKIDSQSDRGGWIGIFFMAFTLVLVSFSCTGPITGSLLVRAANGELLWPIMGMFSFSFAFALPFGLLALFPSWMSSLPKSGSWLNTVKVTLGFLELALAFKFLSQADLGADWNLLSRDLFIAIHVGIGLALSFYLFGIFTIKDEKVAISPLRVIIGIFFLVISLYMLPGMFGAPLKFFSGYLPPITTQEFKFESNTVKSQPINYLCDEPKFAEYLKPIPGLATYFDFDQALECSKKTKKPVFVDFTGKGCANCRRMEENVFTDKEVYESLKNDFIVVSLYVDFDKELPENEWYVSQYDKKTKKTIGAQNADLQITKFKNNAQPYYLILDENGDMLTDNAYAFDLNIPNFKAFLNEGLERYSDKIKQSH